MSVLNLGVDKWSKHVIMLRMNMKIWIFGELFDIRSALTMYYFYEP